MNTKLELVLIAILVSTSCSLLGNFLVIRKSAMQVDSITHTVLLGIVLAFFYTHDLNSPLLIVAATLMGLLTVWFTERLHSTKLLSEDSAIGIIFPLMFSIAIILISRYADSVHLDTDAVLQGELAFAPFDRFKLFGQDIGPKALYTAGFMTLLNLGFIVLFLKELRITTFDPLAATLFGISPVLVHYMLTSLVSLTTVASFQAVGSILVLTFMVGPPATAYLLTDDIKTMIASSAFFAAISAAVGYYFADLFDVSISGSIAVAIGVMFGLALILSPRYGVISTYLIRRRRRREFARMVLLFHLLHHMGTPEECEETCTATIRHHLKWSEKYSRTIIDSLMNDGYIEHSAVCNKQHLPKGIECTEAHCLRLTEKGEAYSRERYKQMIF